MRCLYWVEVSGLSGTTSTKNDSNRDSTVQNRAISSLIWVVQLFRTESLSVRVDDLFYYDCVWLGFLSRCLLYSPCQHRNPCTGFRADVSCTPSLTVFPFSLISDMSEPSKKIPPIIHSPVVQSGFFQSVSSYILLTKRHVNTSKDTQDKCSQYTHLYRSNANCLIIK